MNNEIKLVAMRIRELRTISDLTIEETADKLGIPVEVYASYEEESADIPISAIYAVAQLYNVDMTDILSGISPKMTSLSVVKKDKGIKVERFKGYEYENIAYSFARRTMEPMIVTLMPNDEKPDFVTHEGQEINYCLEGSMVLYHNGNEVLLEAGDCAYFDARKPHGQSAIGEKFAKFLTVINE